MSLREKWLGHPDKPLQGQKNPMNIENCPAENLNIASKPAKSEKTADGGSMI